MRYRVVRKRTRWGYGWIGRIIVKPWRVQAEFLPGVWRTVTWCETWQLAVDSAFLRAYIDKTT